VPRRPPGSGAMSVWLRPGPKPRQPAPAFSRDEITRVAIELADRGGLEAVSMRRIASRIGSAPTSLYWYFSDKDELYELMVDAVIGQVPLLERPSGDWRADLAAIAWAARATLSSHPWFAQVGIHPVAGPQTRPPHRRTRTRSPPSTSRPARSCTATRASPSGWSACSTDSQSARRGRNRTAS